MTRGAFVKEIQELRDDVVSMSSMVDKAIARSTEALRRQDVQLAEEVISGDKAINELRWKIEDHALQIIAMQAPMAKDLRVISSAIHIVTELERMADHAAGNAKIVLKIADEELLKPLVDIPRMSDTGRQMLSDAMTAFIENDDAAAREIITRDDEIDDLYNQIYRELLTYMISEPTTINRATHLLWAAHNLERIGDRATNICERVVFMVTGSMDLIDTGY